MRATICLFAKAPLPGRAKTRLEPVFGAQGAAELAEALLNDALDGWRGVPLLVSETGSMPASLRRRMSGYASVTQGEGDLGQRMERTLRHALASSDAAVVVGTDVPGVGEAVASEALAALQTHDAVLGPAQDGGFYLLALKNCPMGLLEDLPWSCADTLTATRSRLEQHGMSVALLPERFDVDEPNDLRALRSFLVENPHAMRHTRRFLESSRNRSISIIMPVLNEATRLQGQLDALDALDGVSQRIVVDGGSTDDSLAIARAAPKVEVVCASAGRAHQMNAGARIAYGGTLLFVHADAELPSDAAAQIREAMSNPSIQAGAFRLETLYDERGRHRPWVAPFLRMADWRSGYTRYPYGDQALFVRTSAFRALGGYPDLPLFEDLALTMALHEVQPLARARGPVRVSGRRFQERPLYYLALMNSFPLLFRLGVSAERLARFYRDTR